MSGIDELIAEVERHLDPELTSYNEFLPQVVPDMDRLLAHLKVHNEYVKYVDICIACNEVPISLSVFAERSLQRKSNSQ